MALVPSKDGNRNIRGAWHLADNPELYEPQRENNFELQITGLEGLKRADNTAFDDKELLNAEDVIRFSLASTDVPSFSQGKIDVPYGNTTIHFAGKIEYKDLPITLNDYIGADTKSVMIAWQAQSGNAKEETVGLAKNYKKTAYLTEYTPDYKVVRIWKIIGLWIQDLSFGKYSHEQNGKQQINATLVYDKAYPEQDD